MSTVQFDDFCGDFIYKHAVALLYLCFKVFYLCYGTYVKTEKQ